MHSTGETADHVRPSCQWVARETEYILFWNHDQFEPRRVIQVAHVVEFRRLPGIGEFRQVAQAFVRTQDDKAEAVGNKCLQDIVAVGEQLADGVVGPEQGVVADSG
jgi:hypothetical protein